MNLQLQIMAVEQMLRYWYQRWPDSRWLQRHGDVDYESESGIDPAVGPAVDRLPSVTVCRCRLVICFAVRLCTVTQVAYDAILPALADRFDDTLENGIVPGLVHSAEESEASTVTHVPVVFYPVIAFHLGDI